ncbi:MAG TPA: hypothetical protein VKW78_10665 [Terriglobales bacterium]|nr:hypothetical protein [Terriglobales bacterium]
MSKSAAAFVIMIVMCGFVTFAYATIHFESSDTSRFLVLLGVALLAGWLKLKLPGITGNMSINLPFILLGVSELGLLQTLFVACGSTMVQSLKKPRREIEWVQVAFNFFNMALSVGLANYVVHHAIHQSSFLAAALRVSVASGILFLANTIPVSAIISLTEAGALTKIWYRIFLWSFPYYLLSAGVASIFDSLNHHFEWQAPLLVLPLMIAVYHCYKGYFAFSPRRMASVAAD